MLIASGLSGPSRSQNDGRTFEIEVLECGFEAAESIFGQRQIVIGQFEGGEREAGEGIVAHEADPVAREVDQRQVL